MATSTAHPPISRFCPACGRDSSAQLCAWDGTPTVQRVQTGGEDLKFAANDVVAGRYRIEASLGRGGFGSVYRARHVSTGQLVALKFMALDTEDQGDGPVRRFFQEAKITAQLRHPNTVRLYDFGQADNGALFMAMEMLVGPTLERVLREAQLFGKVLGEKRACEIGAAALRSLAEAHASDLVHRDLKPANMVLAEVPGEDRVIKLLDFGIARMRGSSLTSNGTALGTPAYMSPEQCVNHEVDGRSDLYSLAVVLFRCATGQLPFDGEDPLQLMYKHRYEPVPDPRLVAPGEVSDDLATVLMCALAKEPSERFANARTMRTALEAAAAIGWPGTAAVIDLDQELLQDWASKAPTETAPGTPPPLPDIHAAFKPTPELMTVQARSHPAPLMATPATGKASTPPPAAQVTQAYSTQDPLPAAAPRAVTVALADAEDKTRATVQPAASLVAEAVITQAAPVGPRKSKAVVYVGVAAVSVAVCATLWVATRPAPPEPAAAPVSPQKAAVAAPAPVAPAPAPAVAAVPAEASPSAAVAPARPSAVLVAPEVPPAAAAQPAAAPAKPAVATKPAAKKSPKKKDGSFVTD